MDAILKGMAYGDSPIELRMQQHDQSHAEMLAEIKSEALKRLSGDRLKRVLAFIKDCGG